jgi:hypothetical protein
MLLMEQHTALAAHSITCQPVSDASTVDEAFVALDGDLLDDALLEEGSLARLI